MTDVPVLEGYGCRMRPVEVSDAEFIVNLRNQPFAIGKIHATSTSVEKQEEWIRNWKKRDRDYYWIIESAAEEYKPIGTLGLYDILPDNSEGMPGRLVVLPQDKVTILAPFLLMYRFAFEKLGFQRVVMFVVASNRKVRRFHALYGATPIEMPDRYRGTEEEVGVPIVWLGLDCEQWGKMETTWSAAIEGFS